MKFNIFIVFLLFFHTQSDKCLGLWWTPQPCIHQFIIDVMIQGIDAILCLIVNSHKVSNMASFCSLVPLDLVLALPLQTLSKWWLLLQWLQTVPYAGHSLCLSQAGAFLPCFILCNFTLATMTFSSQTATVFMAASTLFSVFPVKVPPTFWVRSLCNWSSQYSSNWITLPVPDNSRSQSI